MDSLPLPKFRSSWLAALIYAVILFLVYYVLAFDQLMKIYESHFVAVPFQRGKLQLQVWAYIPRYSFASGTSSLFIYAENVTDQSLAGVEVFLVTSNQGNQPALLLPNAYGQQVYASGLEFPIIEPHAIATGRISFFAQSQTKITGILVRMQGRPEEFLDPKQTIFVESSNTKALRHSFLEVILLPPWSNGYILALALLATFFVRVEDGTEKDPASLEWQQQLKQDLERSCWVLLTMIGFTAGVFWFLDVVDGTTLPPLLALLALVMIWLGERRPPGIFTKWFAVLGFLLAVAGGSFVVVRLVFFGLGFLFPDVGFFRWQLGDPWIWRFISVEVIFAWFLAWRSQKLADTLLGQLVFWGYSFSALGLVAMGMNVRDGEKEPVAYVLWGMAILIGILTAIPRRRAALASDNHGQA